MGEALTTDTKFKIGKLESSISRILIAVVAAGALSYAPLPDIARLTVGLLLTYGLALTALVYVIRLAVTERSIRIPRTTLAVPAMAFFLVLAVSDEAAAINTVLLSAMSYMGYTFLDSRKDRRHLLVITSFLLTAVGILDLLRLGVQAAAGVPGPPSFGAADRAGLGVFLAFVLPFLGSQILTRKSWLSRYAYVPSFIAAVSYLIGLGPALAAFGALAGLALAPLLAGRKSLRTAVSLALAVALIGTVIGLGHTPVQAPSSAAVVQDQAVASRIAQALNGRPLSWEVARPVSMGAAPILLLLVFLVAMFMQGIPGLRDRSDVERAYVLGVLTGLAGYAVASVAFGNAAVASPAVWLMVGAGGRLVNPLDEGVLPLRLSRLKESAT
ncbi:MAG: hypothetical protein ACYC1U_10860 [Candidatus Aquicultorales bacterium]